MKGLRNQPLSLREREGPAKREGEGLRLLRKVPKPSSSHSPAARGPLLLPQGEGKKGQTRQSDNKTPGGNHMSLTKRAALFAGSALMAAVLSPGAALAANECGVQAGTTLIVCPAGTYGSGITYATTANFNLTTAGAVDVGATGMDITSNAANSITLNTTAGAVSGTGGISVFTLEGTATINAGAVAGGIDVEVRRGGVTVVSTAGDIDVSRAQTNIALTNTNTTNVSLTGNGNITLFHEGSGTITTNAGGGTGLTHIIHTNTRRLDSAAGMLTATVGTGGLLLDITGVAATGASASGAAQGQTGLSSVNGLTVQGSGSAVVNIGRTGFVEGLTVDVGKIILDKSFAKLSGAVNLSGLAGGVEINVLSGGAWELGANSLLSDAGDTLFIGEGGFLHTTRYVRSTGNSNPPTVLVHRIEFGDGEDTLLNEGRILVGLDQVHYSGKDSIDGYGPYARDRNEAELVLQNLEVFENNGEIWMGTSFGVSYSPEYVPLLGDPDKVLYARGTDRVADDILSMPGTTFISGENGRIYMDINLDYLGSAQNRCDASLRDANGDLPAADCINLQNGAAEGAIVLSLTNSGLSARGAYNPDGIVVIDMSDGAGGAGSGAGGAGARVVFSPDMQFYSPNYGGSRDSGMFMSLPIYDPDLMQFRIVGAPSGGAFHQPIAVNGAQQAWRSANASYFDRQADLRDTLRGGEERTSGLWMRAGYDKGERTVEHVFSIPSGDIVYDNTHDLDIASLTIGGDLMGVTSGEDYWVIGGMLGYVRTDIEYESWTDAVSMNGILAGGYASLVHGPLFVDASVSGLWNRMDQTMPQAQLFRDSTLKTDLNTIGAQAEAGWRFDLGVARIEPLVNASWVRTRPRDFKVPDNDPLAPGNQVMFDEAVSTRAGVGLRGSTMVNTGDLAIGLSLTGRYSKEFDGEASAAIGNLNPISPVVTDTFDGNFGELVAGVSIADASGRLSGVLNIGGRKGDDYESVTASAGFRYQW